MTPKQEAALKMALSTLANARDWVGNDPEGRWDEDEMYDELCNMVKFVSEALADSALERMAENARELGLDYEPAPVAKPHEQQEPVAWMNPYGGLVYKRITGHEKNNFTIPLYTSPPASKPHGFAGVTAWIGDATVTRIVTRVQIQHERVAGQSMTQAARVCLDMLAAHGIKGDA